MAQIDGHITLDQLDETVLTDTYIRKNRIACGRANSVPDAATCCANSADDTNNNDPFLEACSSEVIYEEKFIEIFYDN